MNKRLLLFTILFVCESLIKSAYDDCSAFTCSKLSVGTGEKCLLTNSQCEVHYDSCQSITDGTKCESNILSSEPYSKCTWGTSCTKTNRLCEDYSTVSSLGVICKNLKTADDNTKICVLNGATSVCTQELKSVYGCSTSSEGTCTDKIPIDENNKIEPLKKCVIKGSTCSPELKKCGDHTNLDNCISLLTSDNTNTKKRCFLSGTTCAEKNIKCEGYNDDVENEEERDEDDCAAITPYIIQSDNTIKEDVYSKCVLDTDKKCKAVKKKCSEISDPTICVNHVLDDNKKRCVYKSNSCIEQFKTCAFYDAQTSGKNQPDCEAIEEDSSHKCVFTSGTCENKLKKCADYNSNSVSCNLISLNNTHKCEHTGTECIEQYKECELYTGNNRKKCESITPPEQNMRCILKEDSQCVSVPRECEEHTDDNEYECINNYKPLDENYICAFNNANDPGEKCEKRLKFVYEYCYLGDSTNCASIKPKSKGENYSIKCSLVDNKCSRVEKPCSDGNGGDAESCASIIPKNSIKKCILIGSTCTEEYKTCNDYNSDTDPTTIDSTKCTGITSIDGKKCTYAAPTESAPRGTCSGVNNLPCSEFDSTTFSNACVSIPLNDITKKCVYKRGDCIKENKKCSELIFNGNESGIEEKCKSAPTEDEDNVCIISSDKKSCIEVDKSKAPKDTTPPTTKPNQNNQSTNTNPNNGQGQETDSNFGKEIYLNKLLIIILCLLF